MMCVEADPPRCCGCQQYVDVTADVRDGVLFVSS